MKLNKIIFITDVFRSAEFGLSNIAQNRHWLRGLFYDLFNSFNCMQKEFAPVSEGGCFQADRYRNILGLPLGADGWASAITTCIPPEAEFLFAELTDATVVIGWSLTPAIINFLSKHNIIFIDIEIDPIRFSRDLFFRMRTNSESLLEVFSNFNISDDSFELSVANIRGYVARREPDSIQSGPSLGLFVGQTKVDLALVSSGKLQYPEFYCDKIQKIADSVDFLLVKEHPFQLGSDHILPILKNKRNYILCDANIYRILADTKLQHVVGLSSSVLEEASLFRLKTTKLISPDRDRSPLIPAAARQWFRVPPQILAAPSFRCALLGPPILEKAPPCSRTTYQDTFDLRKNLGSGWGLDGFYSGDSLGLDLNLHRATAHCRQRISGREMVPFLVDGWSAMENWGCWSVGSRHKIAFTLSDFERWKKVAAVFDIRGFVSENHPQQRVKVHLNGKLVADRILRLGDHPRASLSVAISSPDATIVIETPDAKSPAELGLGSDTRRLGIGLSAISFSVATWSLATFAKSCARRCLSGFLVKR